MTQRFYAKYLNNRTIHLITFLGFVFGFSSALLTYVTSTYFKQVINSDNIAVFYVITFALTLVALFNLDRLIEGFGRARTLMSLLFIQVGILFYLQFIPISIGGALFLMLYILFSSIIAVVFDIVLEAYSKDGNTGRIRGIFLSVWNLGFLVGPLCSVYLLEHFGFGSIFFVVMIIYVVMFLTVFMALNDIKGHVKKKSLSIKQTVNLFHKNTALFKIYWISFTLRFFYVIMTIFIPLYLRDIGLSWEDIGIIFTVMLLPFIFVEYPAGYLADTKFGEKEMLFLGMFILIISVWGMFAVDSASLIFWTSIFFISRIGAALVESMQDSYFYKQINDNDVALINFFRSTRTMAYVTASLLMGLVLFLVNDISIIFIVLLLVLIIGFYPIIMLRDTEPNNKI